jgi:hypothetical protein
MLASVTASAQSKSQSDDKSVAQSSAAASECYAAAEKAEDNIGLRLQGGDTTAGRTAARIHLWRAEIAAARGDEAECWDQIGWSKYLVK